MKDSKVFLKKKKKMQQYACERYKNLPEDEKQKFFECRSIFHKMTKKHLIIIIRTIILKRNDLESSFDEE